MLEISGIYDTIANTFAVYITIVIVTKSFQYQYCKKHIKGIILEH